MADQDGPARIYPTGRADVPWQVVHRDPTRREKSGRAKRVVKWFGGQDAETRALAYRDRMNESLLTEGAAGVAFDANLRGDAIAARRKLDAAGHSSVSLVQLAADYAARVSQPAAADVEIGLAVESFLEEKRSAERRTEAAVRNLSDRLWRWINAEHITHVGGINRGTVEPLRTRAGVSAQSRRNDMAAVSSFCSWLVDGRLLAHHPLKGVRRPTVPRRTPAVLTPEACAAMLERARAIDHATLAAIAVMIFVGARPSEIAHTRIYYGRQPCARIEGGKLRGRANRSVPLSPAASAWLRLAGSPGFILPLTRRRREVLAKAAGIRWTGDVCRHTYISNRLALLKDDAAVAREAGTSEAVIYRHYHRLVSEPAAKRWQAIRPKIDANQTAH